jgi:polyribonucleotide nucleotidyltransferase
MKYCAYVCSVLHLLVLLKLHFPEKTKMNKNKIVKKEIEYAGKKLILETGELAFQSNMSIKATYGDTVVLATVVAGEANPDIDFFPLTVSYEEKLYASGSIKTSRFVKRDGKPTDEAVVTKRLIDHAIRPLFPSDYMDEVQVITTVLSLDDSADPEFLSLIATSAALQSSDIPWEGPSVSVRVGYKNDYILNPPKEQALQDSDLDMVVSFVGDDLKFLAVEGEADVLPEEAILGAFEFARNNSQPLLDLINEFANEINPEKIKYEYESKKVSDELLNDVVEFAKPRVVEMMDQGFDKTKLKSARAELWEEIIEKFEGKYKKTEMLKAFNEVEKHALQHLILEEGKRPDGRGIKEVRSIATQVGVLPRTHGSGLFTRGDTQVLTAATLGSPTLELLIQNMYGERTKRFLHYYNFPPYSVGETGRIGGPGSREIGHGMLVEKGLRAVIPNQEQFPYTIVLMSETLASSGSSSMASACASTLALMDAGVPITEMVAGVGVGLIVNDDMSKQLIMTDLAYMEDAYGFMDFKMTGTRRGVTALQADIKAKGLPMDLLPKVIEQSREGRMHVLDEMEKTISQPRADVSKYAPRMYTLKIDPAKIGVVIGSGGRTIREIQEKTGTEIGIEEDGTVMISSPDEVNAKKALDIVERLTKDVEPGEVYEGLVKEIVDFGAFVEILPGKQGLLHVSELSNEYVKSVTDVIKEGDTVQVKVLEVGRDGKVSLSKRALEPGYDGPRERPNRRDSNRGHQGGRGGNRRDFDRRR